MIKTILTMTLAVVAARGQIMIQPIVNGKVPPVTPTAPTFVQATPSIATLGAGNVYHLGGVTVGSGQGVFVGFTARQTSTSTPTCSTITAATSSSGDTLTSLGTILSSGNFAACISVWYVWPATAASSYVITLTGGSGSPSGIATTIAQFTTGTLTGTLDGSTCSNTSTSGNHLQCSAAISPTGSIELFIGMMGAYDTLSSPGDNSSPTFNVNNAWNESNSGGSVLFSYLIANPTSGTYLPGWQSVGAGDPLAIMGIPIK